MRIVLNLSENSVNAAMKEISAYSVSVKRKSETLRRRISEELEKDIRDRFAESVYNGLTEGGTRTPDVTVTTGNRGDITVVLAQGEEAVFVEFGAGVYHNTPAGSTPHEWGAEHGFTIGTYGKGHGARRAWGYVDEDGLHITRGTPAQMPMYNAVKNILPRIPEIAKEVFAE